MDPRFYQLIEDVAALQAQVEWLTYLVRTALYASMGTFLTSIISIAANFILLKRNSKK